MTDLETLLRESLKLTKSKNRLSQSNLLVAGLAITERTKAFESGKEAAYWGIEPMPVEYPNDAELQDCFARGYARGVELKDLGY